MKTTFSNFRLFTGSIAVVAILTMQGLSAADNIKIGVIAPTSGGGAVVGLPIIDGVKLAVEEINAAGGINGQKLEIIVRDEQLKPDVATAAAKELIAKEGVKALIGPATSATGLAVSEIAKTEKIVNISPTAKAESITGDKFHKYIFQLPATSDVDGKRFSGVLSKIGAKSVCLFGYDYAYTHDWFKSLRANLPSNISVTNEYLFPLGTTDFNTLITRVSADSCDTIVGSLFGGGFVAFAKQAGPFGLFKSKKLVWGSQIGDNSMAATLKGDYPEGMWTHATDVWYVDLSEAHKTFLAGLAKIQGKKETDMWPIAGYDAMLFLAAAIKKAGSTDSDALVSALEGLSIESPLGTLTIDPKTHRVSTPEFFGQMQAVSGSDIKRMSSPELIK